MSLTAIDLTIRHLVNKQRLERKPEPSQVSDGLEQTKEYSQSKNSIMVVPYFAALNIIDKLCPINNRNSVLELCTGPGNFTEMLVKNANFKKITGVDLSEKMLAYARENANQAGIEKQITLIHDDVTQLKKLGSEKYDLITFMNAAHHLTDIQSVKEVLTNATFKVKDDGIIFLMDLVRPKTKKIAENYIKFFGKDYLKKGLNYFHKDFNDSVYAAWSVDELKQAIPKDSDRTWIHLLPYGFPAFQFIIGLPKGESKIQRTTGVTSNIKKHIPNEFRTDYYMLITTIKIGKLSIVK